LNMSIQGSNTSIKDPSSEVILCLFPVLSARVFAVLYAVGS